MHADAASIHNQGIVAFLRYRLTTEEQAWPRMQPVLRAVSDVPIGELRVHPDLIDRLVAIDAPNGAERLRMLMGAAILVADSGVAYALAYSQQFLALRLPPGLEDAVLLAIRQNPVATSTNEARGRQQPARIDALGNGWTLVEPWSAPLESLRAAVREAHIFADAMIVST